jgi:pimeloyl-ACP methyl ester carboxylesterase/2-polyprenyl-6-methoxyphenol hydroxylase-like FAD-dependent oxidoreductase
MMPRDTHAVVIGGSMAGLLAARVLADFFTNVTLVERDRFADVAEARKGVGQGRHIHTLLAGGLQVLNQLFPDLEATLVREGANTGDYTGDVYWHQFGRYRRRFASGIRAVAMTRPFLELHVRRRVLALPNLVVRQGCSVEQLLASQDRSCICGVVLRDRAGGETVSLPADLVVDASGRGSHSPQWLEELGYARPAETIMTVDLAYATRLYERRHLSARGQAFALVEAPGPPDNKRAAALFPVEGERWQLTLAGYLGDHPPTDEAGLLEFARSLSTPDIYEMIRNAQPLSEIALYTYRASRRRHYERLRRFPEGYLVLGDALCSFNPLFGQGMTVCAQEAIALRSCLAEQRAGTANGLAPAFFRRAAAIVDAPWIQVTGEDLRFPEVKGRRTPDVIGRLWYVEQVQRAAMDDPAVSQALTRVLNLLDRPTGIMRPRVVRRTLQYRFGKRMAGAKPPEGPPLVPSRLHGYAILGDVRLHYVELGCGPLVILLHGFPEHWYAWRYQIPALAAAGFRVVAPDLRGYNLSSRPAGVEAYQIDRLAGDIAGLVAKLGAERASVAGHDWGGGVAWQFAMRYPHMLDRLAILNSPHPDRMLRAFRTWRQLRKSWYMFFFALPWLPEAVFRAGDFAGLRRALRDDTARRGAFGEGDIERFVEALKQPGALTAGLNYYRAMGQAMLRSAVPEWRRVEAPTLIIWGERDQFLGRELAEPDPALVPNARVERLPDASHWVQSDCPARVNELLVEFLRS